MGQVMAHRDPSSPTPMPTILRYGIAVLSVAIAIGLDFFLLRHFEVKLTPFLFAVAATVWYAGTGPGVLAIVLSILSLNYFFLHSFFSSPISYADLVYLTFCTFCALAVGWVSAVRRRAEQELRQAREELEAKVVERTANLQRSESYLAEAQRLSHTGSWVLNVAARETTHWSQETYRLYGFDPEGRIPPFEALLQRIHPEDRGRFVDDLERAIRERTNHEMIFRAVLPDGTLKYILGIGHPVFNASGDVVEFVGAAMDIPERKRAEVVGQRLAAIVDSSEDAIVSKALNGTIESWNGGAERLFGYQASEIIGKSIRIIIPPDRHDEEQGILERIRRGQRIKPYETVRMREDGSLLDISLTVSPLRDAAGRIIGASKIARDITERKRAEAALRDMQMQLAHANRVATMGQLSASIILEVIALTGAEAANNSVSVRTQLAEGLPRVQGDRVQLQQVLLNLIINAIEAMRDVCDEERELLISTRNEPDGVSVEVRDSGPGFAPAAPERVFEAFYTTKPGGLGLGLSICRSIIEAHNERLWASPNVPRGAIFGFIAPARPAAAS